VLFPLADLPKSEIREIAREAGFTNAEKKDSTGICFVGERNYSQFLQKYLEKNPGEIVDQTSGNVVGEHIGLSFYTLGQRRELHIGGVKGAKESPWFVVRKNFADNQLVVSQNEEDLLSSELTASKLSWASGSAPEKSDLQARIRYRSEPVPCTVKIIDEDQIHVTFSNPVRSVTPGQALVLYDGEVCVGGGEIN